MEVIPVPPARMPGTVLTAGILWILFGSFLIIYMGINLLAVFTVPMHRDPGLQRGFVGVATCVSILVGLFAAAFLFVGLQTVRGTARDTLGNGIGSLIFGALLLSDGVAQGLKGVYVPMLLSFLGCCGLLTAGVLALVGRSAYREYRRSRQPMPYRRRRVAD
jgi:hypothetical protein